MKTREGQAEVVTDQRPSWQIDLKWLFGLAATAVLSLTFIVAVAAELTKREPAVEIIALTTASLFSPGEIDSQSIAAFKAQVAQSPKKQLELFPGTGIIVTEADLVQKSPSELKHAIFSQLGAKIYDNESEVGSKELGILALFTDDIHQVIQRVLWASLAVVLLFLLPVMWFSYRFGRLISLGVVTLAAAIPATILLVAAKIGLAQINLESLLPADPSGRFAALQSALLPVIIDKILTIYIRFGVVALILIVFGLILNQFVKPKAV